MIIGIGIDIVDVSRIRIVFEKHGARFLKKIFTLDEISYCAKKRDSSLCLAARFAAKEATIKAFGGKKGIEFKNIEIKRTSGKPMIQLAGKAKVVAKDKGIKAIHLSISHEKTHAVACVIMEG